MLICQFCMKECKNKNSLAQHERCCPSNPNRNYKNGMFGKKGTNQYSKAKELGVDAKMSESTKQKISGHFLPSQFSGRISKNIDSYFLFRKRPNRNWLSISRRRQRFDSSRRLLYQFAPAADQRQGALILGNSKHRTVGGWIFNNQQNLPWQLSGRAPS